jgi:hypothetical protein
MNIEETLKAIEAPDDYHNGDPVHTCLPIADLKALASAYRELLEAATDLVKEAELQSEQADREYFPWVAKVLDGGLAAAVKQCEHDWQTFHNEIITTPATVCIKCGRLAGTETKTT